MLGRHSATDTPYSLPPFIVAMGFPGTMVASCKADPVLKSPSCFAKCVVFLRRAKMWIAPVVGMQNK